MTNGATVVQSECCWFLLEEHELQNHEEKHSCTFSLSIRTTLSLLTFEGSSSIRRALRFGGVCLTQGRMSDIHKAFLPGDCSLAWRTLNLGVLPVLVILAHLVPDKNKNGFFYLELQLVESVILRYDGLLHTKVQHNLVHCCY